jgi:hypothetical protein
MHLLLTRRISLGQMLMKSLTKKCHSSFPVAPILKIKNLIASATPKMGVAPHPASGGNSGGNFGASGPEDFYSPEISPWILIEIEFEDFAIVGVEVDMTKSLEIQFAQDVGEGTSGRLPLRPPPKGFLDPAK